MNSKNTGLYVHLLIGILAVSAVSIPALGDISMDSQPSQINSLSQGEITHLQLISQDTATTNPLSSVAIVGC